MVIVVLLKCEQVLRLFTFVFRLYIINLQLNSRIRSEARDLAQ